MTVNDVSKNYLNSAMVKIATGSRINSAADDAVGMAISEKMEALIQGLEQGTDNTYNMQNLVNTAEGGLSTINDSLLRIRELGVQAANGIYGDDDRAMIQGEINQMLDQVKSVTGSLEFNKKKLLDGSASSLHTASYADGGGMTVNIPNVNDLLKNLEGFDVTKGNVDFDAIDEAISAISTVRGDLGAASNRMDHTVNSNSITMLNQMAAKSQIADADIAKSVMDLNKERILGELQIYSQKMQMERMKKGTMSLLQ